MGFVRGCEQDLQPILDGFDAYMTNYRQMAEAVFQAKTIFTTEQICEITRNETDNTNLCGIQSRSKRLIAAGAYVMAGASMAMATSALGLASRNAHELEKIKHFVEENTENILQVKEKLHNLESKQDVIIDTQKSLLGYVQNLTVYVDKMNDAITCVKLSTQYQNVVNEVREQVQNIIQFIFQGQTYGRLNPLLIDPEKLARFITSESTMNSQILEKFPSLMYQSAKASLIDADFDRLQFTFLLSYPYFGKNPIYPFFSARQIGFLAQFEQENETQCLMINMPQHAVVHDNSLYALRTPLTCPHYGNVVICELRQLELYPMENCVDVNVFKNSKDEISRQLICPMLPCHQYQKQEDTYVSTKAGILLRTTAASIQVAYNLPKHQLDLYKTGNIKTIEMDESGAIFIPWQSNISSVTFGKTVIYSPVNADNQARIKISPMNPMPFIDTDSLLAIPKLGTQTISKLIRSQQEKLSEIEKKMNSINPEHIIYSKTKLFNMPLWATCAIVAATTSIIGYTIHGIYAKLRKCSINTNNYKAPPQYEAIQQPQITTLSPVNTELATITEIEEPYQKLLKIQALPKSQTRIKSATLQLY